MKVEIKVPASGESIQEADIARWFKKDGDYVETDDLIVELETDKASLEIAAEASGQLSIKVDEGETVQVGDVIGEIETSATAKQAAKEDTQPAEPENIKVETDEEQDDDDTSSSKRSTIQDKNMPSPAARKLLAENKLSAQDVEGTGKDGRITKADVIKKISSLQKTDQVTESSRSYSEKLKHALKDSRESDGGADESTAEEKEERQPRKPMDSLLGAVKRDLKKDRPEQSESDSATREVRFEKMSRLRRTIAKRLVDAQQMQAQLSTFNEIDMHEVMQLRSKYKETFKEKYGVNLGFMSFFTRAVTIALSEFPIINAMVEDDQILYHDYCDIGIAVASPKGLVVPVVRNAESLSFQDIESTIKDYALRARDGKLSLDELSGGTFTITNGGTFGSMLSTPIVNFPQSAILGMHNIVNRPWVVDGEIKVRPIMYIALSYDHRIIDGSGAVRFLYRVKELIEDPSRLMLQV